MTWELWDCCVTVYCAAMHQGIITSVLMGGKRLLGSFECLPQPFDITLTTTSCPVLPESRRTTPPDGCVLCPITCHKPCFVCVLLQPCVNKLPGQAEQLGGFPGQQYSLREFMQYKSHCFWVTMEVEFCYRGNVANCFCTPHHHQGLDAILKMYVYLTSYCNVGQGTCTRKGINMQAHIHCCTAYLQ